LFFGMRDRERGKAGGREYMRGNILKN